ncbi:hypothetical protein [Paraburkholderia sprentiae]|nr:hypothetical protein [Paraburkholderia sprentiae]
MTSARAWLDVARETLRTQASADFMPGPGIGFDAIAAPDGTQTSAGE